MTIASAIGAFIIDQKARGNSAITIDYYSRSLRKFTDFLKLEGKDGDLEKVDVFLCRAYIAYLRDTELHSVSVQSYVRGLRSFLNWCFEEELIENDICRRLKLPKAQSEIVFFVSTHRFC